MAQLLPVEVFDLIIFGGTGDLAMRKLLPALYHRDRDGQFLQDSRIIAVGRSALSRDAYLKLVEKSLRANLADGDYEAKRWAAFRKRISYIEADALAPKQWGDLVSLLRGSEDRTRVAYLATAPSLFGHLVFRETAPDLVIDVRRGSEIAAERFFQHDAAVAGDQAVALQAF